jgi:hypothetical protein
MADRNHFDQDLRSRFEGFEPEPPAGVWLGIEKGLQAPAAAVMAPWVFRVAAAIAVLSVTAFSFWYFSTYNQDVRSLAGFLDTVPGIQPDVTISTDAEGTDASVGFSGGVQPSLMASLVTPEPEGLATDEPAVARPRTGALPALLQGAQGILESHSRPGMLAFVRTSLPEREDLSPRGFEAAGGDPGLFALSVFVAPQYNDRHLSGASSVPFSLLEQESMTTSYGVLGSFRLGKRLEVQSGVTYLNMAQLVNEVNALSHADRRQFYNPADVPVHPQSILTSLGSISLSDPTLYFEDTGAARVSIDDETKGFMDIEDPKLLSRMGLGLTQNFSFVEVPLILRYQLLDRRVGIQLKAGVAASFLMRNEVLLSGGSDADRVIGKTEGLREQYYSGIGGLVLSYPLSHRLRFFVEPTGQVFLNPVLQEELTAVQGKAYLYNFSLYSGISYRF